MKSTLETRMRAVELVVIGASAGGVDALITLLAALPARWHLPMVVVLHLPEDHESRLPAVFADRLHLPVHEAQLVTYLKLTGKPVGLLMNFNVPVMKDGIKRKLNDLEN